MERLLTGPGGDRHRWRRLGRASPRPSPLTAAPCGGRRDRRRPGRRATVAACWLGPAARRRPWLRRGRPSSATRRFAGAVERYARLVDINNVGHYLFAGTRFEEHHRGTVGRPRCCQPPPRAAPHQGRVAGPDLDSGDGGSINVSTVEAFRGIPHHPVYGVQGRGGGEFTESLAVDVGIHRDPRERPRARCHLLRAVALRPRLTDEDRAKVPGLVLLGAAREPADTAGAAVFLGLGALSPAPRSRSTRQVLAAGGVVLHAAAGRGWTNRPFDA